MLDDLVRIKEEAPVIKITKTKESYDRLCKMHLQENYATSDDDSDDESHYQETKGEGSKDGPDIDANLDDINYQLALKRRRCILKNNSNGKFIWDIFIIIIAIFVCFTSPYVFSFSNEFPGKDIFDAVCLSIDIIFFVDIIVIFRTSYVNNMTGDEIYSPSLIAKNYLFSSRFVLDFLSSLPFDYFKLGTGYVGDILSLITMLKIVRVTRINVIISNLNVKQDLKAMLKVIYLIFILFLYLHVYACFFWYIVVITYQWVPPLDFIYNESEIYD